MGILTNSIACVTKVQRCITSKTKATWSELEATCNTLQCDVIMQVSQKMFVFTLVTSENKQKVTSEWGDSTIDRKEATIEWGGRMRTVASHKLHWERQDASPARHAGAVVLWWVHTPASWSKVCHCLVYVQHYNRFTVFPSLRISLPLKHFNQDLYFKNYLYIATWLRNSGSD